MALSARTHSVGSRTQRHSVRSRARVVVCKAVVTPEVAAAVAQQAVAYSAATVAEGLYTRSHLPEDDKGRPATQIIAAGAGGTAVAAALMSVGGFVGSAGLIVGVLASSAMCFLNFRRAMDVQYDDGDWPGNKAWPSGMVLISFFILAAFMQALVQDIITPSA